MHISPKLTAQVTLPKASFSPLEHYFQADLGEGATGNLPPGLGGGRWELCGVAGGGGEREKRGALAPIQGLGKKIIPSLQPEYKSSPKKPHASLSILKNAH